MIGWRGVSEQGWRKGPWTPEEDKLLTDYVTSHGDGRWSSVSKCSGLNRTGKSCRLRWVNYLRPGLKRGHITPQEEGIIIELHSLWGNKWSTISRYLPGRTDNEIKNYWRTHFKKKRKTAGGSEKQQEKKKFQRGRNRQPGEDEIQLEANNNLASVSPPLSEVTAGDPIPNRMSTTGPPEAGYQQQEEEERLSTYTDMENQCFPATYNNNNNNNNNNINEVLTWPTSETNIPVDGLWGWLWNLDDQINWRGSGWVQTGDFS